MSVQKVSSRFSNCVYAAPDGRRYPWDWWLMCRAGECQSKVPRTCPLGDNCLQVRRTKARHICSLGAKCPEVRPRKARHPVKNPASRAIFKNKVAEIAYKDIGVEPVTNPPNSVQVAGVKDIGVEPITNPPNSVQVAGVEDIGVEPVTDQPNSVQVAGVEDIGVEPITNPPKSVQVAGVEDIGVEPVMDQPNSVQVAGVEDIGVEPVTNPCNSLQQAGVEDIKVEPVTNPCNCLQRAGVEDIKVEPVTSPPNSLQEVGVEDIGVEPVTPPPNSLQEVGVEDIGLEPVTPPLLTIQEAYRKMSLTSSSCDSCFSYVKDPCCFGEVIYPQFLYKREPPPLICRLVSTEDNNVDSVVEDTPISLEEEGANIQSQGHSSPPHKNNLGVDLVTNPSYSLQEGTRLKSQGQHKNPPCSHKGLKNPPYSHQAPKIALVLGKAQEALKKKLKRMTRHEQNLLILKKFLRVIPEKKGGYNGVFFATSFPSKANVRRVEKMVKKMATRLALVSLREWMLNVSTYLGVEVTNSNFDEAFEEPLFKSVAQFILHTFDMEDFERFNCWHKLQLEYTKFWVENEILLNLKSENPYKFFAEGKINLDAFPLLTEGDLGSILRLLVIGLGGSDNLEGCHDHFVEMARTVLLEYVPMQEDVKMYSILGRGCTLDAICDEALSNIDRILDLTKCDEILARSLKGFLASMTKRRYDMLNTMCHDVSYVLKDGEWGSFAKEVSELVHIAEVRRRFLSHRFISKHHILWAVRSTEFKDLVDRLVKDIGLRDLVEKPATCPPYSVYICAQTTADIHGAEEVGVEHIVVATIFEMSQRRHRKNLTEFNNIHCVKEFLDAVRDYKRKYDDQEDLDSVNSWIEVQLYDGYYDISLNAEDDECDVDTVKSENGEDHLDDGSCDISLNAEDDDECDVDIYYHLDDYYLEYVNKKKIKNLRSKKYKTYRWTDADYCLECRAESKKYKNYKVAGSVEVSIAR
ncbi:hypothetical protein PTKIN_Ptkin14bG0000100 [Pterospermum kingtungense]